MSREVQHKMIRSEGGSSIVIPGLFPGKPCPVCGKEFHITNMEDWGWKAMIRGKNGYGTQMCVCTYSCMRKAERCDGYVGSTD